MADSLYVYYSVWQKLHKLAVWATQHRYGQKKRENRVDYEATIILLIP